MLRASSSWALVLTLFLFGCPEKAKPKPEVTKPAAAAQPAAAKAGGEAGARKMANCPSSVEGAATAIVEQLDAVVVTVTASAESATTEIRTRAKHLAAVSVKNPTEVKHDGEGDGGGGLGNCPVVLAGTTITTEDVPGGAKLTVKPENAGDLAKLKQATKDRNAKLGAPAPKHP